MPEPLANHTLDKTHYSQRLKSSPLHLQVKDVAVKLQYGVSKKVSVKIVHVVFILLLFSFFDSLDSCVCDIYVNM